MKMWKCDIIISIETNNIIKGNPMINKEKVYIYHSDPGHGWLAVKFKELARLNILDKISPYSYMRGKTVYLEEDQDMGTFIQALKENNIEFKYRSSYQEKTPIRYYDSFKIQYTE